MKKIHQHILSFLLYYYNIWTWKLFKHSKASVSMLGHSAFYLPFLPLAVKETFRGYLREKDSTDMTKCRENKTEHTWARPPGFGFLSVMVFWSQGAPMIPLVFSVHFQVKYSRTWLRGCVLHSESVHNPISILSADPCAAGVDPLCASHIL